MQPNSTHTTCRDPASTMEEGVLCANPLGSTYTSEHLAVNKARMRAHAQALSKLGLKTAPLLAILNGLDDDAYAACDPARSPCAIALLTCLTCVIHRDLDSLKKWHWENRSGRHDDLFQKAISSAFGAMQASLLSDNPSKSMQTLNNTSQDFQECIFIGAHASRCIDGRPN